MKATILQSNYVPWKGYFDLIHDVDLFVFYDCVKYTKNDWRNRNVICTKNGIQWLTIPVSSTATGQMIEEVQLPDSKWRKQHLRSLEVGYGRAPFYSQLRELMTEFLCDDEILLLSEMNQRLITHIARRLECKTVFRNAREFPLPAGRVERLVHILKSVGATQYITGHSAANYLTGHEFKFMQANIDLRFKQYGPYKQYEQLSSPFNDNVSILDLVANVSWSNIPEFIWNNSDA